MNYFLKVLSGISLVLFLLFSASSIYANPDAIIIPNSIKISLTGDLYSDEKAVKHLKSENLPF